MKRFATALFLLFIHAFAGVALADQRGADPSDIPDDQFLFSRVEVPFVSDGVWCDVAIVNGISWVYGIVDSVVDETARVGVFAKIRAVPASVSGHVDIPASFENVPVTAIDAMAFYGCDRITSVMIPDGVQSLGDYAFYGCSSLASVSLPASVTSIGHHAFGACPLMRLDVRDGTPIRASAKAFAPTTSDSVPVRSAEEIQETGFTRNKSTVPQGAKAKNTAANCIVSFNANGGSVDVAAAVYTAGEILGHLPIPVRDGYRFEGWFDNPNPGLGTLVTVQSIAPETILSLYARWELPDTDPWQPVFRFYSKNYKGHFFTMDAAEKATLMCTNPNWKYEGVAYYAAQMKLSGTVPLYRFYSKNYRGHFYTIDEDEMWTVRNTNPNWKYEGIAYYVFPSADSDPNGESSPIYRFWSKVYRHHFYTISEAEMTAIRTSNPNWNYEGIAFWTQPVPHELTRYTILFNGNGGNGVMAPISAAKDRSSTLPACAFENEGFSFVGWAATANGPVAWQAGETAVLNLASTAGATAVLYAIWEGGSYTVSFDPNGGSGTMASHTFVHGRSESLPACSFAREGYSFEGWATSPSGLTVYTDGQGVSDLGSPSDTSVTLYAKWTPGSFTVRFDPNGGTGEMSDQAFVYDVAQNLAANAFSREGWGFAGWATSATGAVSYGNRASVKNFTATSGGTVTLYAKWTANTYTVKFNANGGSGSMSNQSFAYGTAQALTANAFSRTGHSFAGWATSASGAKVYNDRQSVQNLTATAGGTVNLYAVWTPISYSVKFNANGGSGSMSNQSFVYGTAQSLTANAFTREGWYFAGWSTSATGAKSFGDRQTVSNLTTTVGATVQLYAMWESLYMVVDLSGGANASSYPVSYLTAVPSGGWSDEYRTTKLVLRRVEAGSFMMGSPADEVGARGVGGDVIWDQEDQHWVTLTRPFYIGVFEVTQQQWLLVMGKNPSHGTNVWYHMKCPAESMVFWQIRGYQLGNQWPESSAVDSNSFMGRLRSRTGLDTFDLPTEAQWEYACRAGTTTALNNGYNLTNIYQDDNMDKVGRYAKNGGGTSFNESTYANAKVGSYLPNNWGLYDMHGNVAETCLDRYTDHLGTAPVIDPKGPSTGGNFVQRGGDSHSYARNCRSASRWPGIGVSSGNTGIGLRVVRNLPLE